MTKLKTAKRKTKKTTATTTKPLSFNADGSITLDVSFDITITDTNYDADMLQDDVDEGRVTVKDCDLTDRTKVMYQPEDGEARQIGWITFCLCSPDEDCLQTSDLYNYFAKEW